MEHLSYAGVLLGIIIGSAWLEFAVRTRVLRRARRLALSVAPVLLLFVIWDVLAVRAGHWSFDPDRVVGAELAGRLPVEEIAFFVVIPFAAILTLEAVRAVRGWAVGDEPESEKSGAP
ncbi:MAG TPA: lycopene cyclase domain-containing protein [Actinomycetes bacterium]|nr:lycopene cyclase domain-containing protein [Actinomycetes bacterium]